MAQGHWYEWTQHYHRTSGFCTAPAPEMDDQVSTRAEQEALSTVHTRASARIGLTSAESGWETIAASRFLLGRVDVTLPPLAAPTFGINYGGLLRIERTLNGRRTAGSVTPGHVAILPPDAATRWSFDRTGDIVLVSLSPNVVDEAIEDGAERNPQLAEIVPRFLIRDLVLERIAHQLLRGLCEPHPDGRLAAQVLAQELARHLIAAHSNLAPRTPTRYMMAPGKLRRTEEFIRANLSREISLQQLADAAGMSLYHFAKTFKQATGRAPHRYLTEQRLRQARVLLHDATLSISDVARAVGLRHSHFTVLFNRYMGMAPAKFREVLRA
jgi:AraC family transcriptional regulator